MSTIVRLGQRESTNARGPVWYDSTPVCELGFREFSFVLYSATPPLQPTTAAPVLRSTWYLGLFVSCLTYTVGSDKQILLSSSRTILLYYDDNESIDSNACVCGPAVSPAGSSAWSNNEPRRRLGIVQGTEIHSLKNTQCIVLNARRRTSQNASCAPLYCTILSSFYRLVIHTLRTSEYTSGSDNGYSSYHWFNVSFSAHLVGLFRGDWFGCWCFRYFVLRGWFRCFALHFPPRYAFLTRWSFRMAARAQYMWCSSVD